jgi:hypothetical protein
MPEPEALKFVESFLAHPPLDREAKRAGAEAVIQILTNHREQLENVRGLNYFLLGGLAYQLRTDAFWQYIPNNEPHWAWNDFCEMRLGMSAKKADALERVWKRAIQVQMTASEVEKIGWATADAILRYANDRRDVNLLLEQYELAPTRSEFVMRLRGRMGEKNGNRAVFQKHLRFTEEEVRTFDTVLHEIAHSMKKELYINMRPEEAILAILVMWKRAIEEARGSNENA